MKEKVTEVMQREAPSLPPGWHNPHNPVYIYYTPGELLEGSAMWKSTTLTIVLLETFEPQ